MKRDLLEHNMNEKDAIFFRPRNRSDHGAWLIPIQQKPIVEEDTPQGRSRQHRKSRGELQEPAVEL
jgi:hemerythrin superfamily protein